MRELVDYAPIPGACDVGACTDHGRPQNDPRETSGPQIDRIPPARPPWRDRQYRELKKLFFSAPSECPIDLLGPLSNRTILKRLHARSDLLASVLHAASLQRFWTYFALNHDRDRFRDARSHKKAAHWCDTAPGLICTAQGLSPGRSSTTRLPYASRRSI